MIFIKFKNIGKKSFEHYQKRYIDGLKDEIKNNSNKKNVASATIASEELKKMIMFYPEQTKELLMELMDSKDVRVSIIAAMSLARNFDMDIETKNKARIIKKNFCNSKYCTPIIEISLIGFPDIHNKYR